MYIAVKMSKCQNLDIWLSFTSKLYFNDIELPYTYVFNVYTSKIYVLQIYMEFYSIKSDLCCQYFRSSLYTETPYVTGI